MTIGQVAKQAGLRASAIRFYEKTGLLPRPLRSSGQRRYDHSVLERLALLEFAKQCGFNLAEIRELFHGATRLSDRMHDLAGRKIVELDLQIERIALMKEFLQRAQRCRCIDLQQCGSAILRGRCRTAAEIPRP